MTATFTHIRNTALRQRLILETAGTRKSAKGESALETLKARGITTARTRKAALTDLERHIVGYCKRNGLKAPAWSE